MNLIASADLYDSGPLDDSAEGIGKLIDQAVSGGQFPAEMKSMAGRWYAKFVQEVNWSKEHKDTELTMLMVCCIPRISADFLVAFLSPGLWMKANIFGWNIESS